MIVSRDVSMSVLEGYVGIIRTACCDNHSCPESLRSHTYSGSVLGFSGAFGAMVFIQSRELLGLLPIPFRRMVKPAPEVALNSRSITADRFGSGNSMIPLALWKASLNPKPSIGWNFLVRSTVSFSPDCLDSSPGTAATTQAQSPIPARERIFRDSSAQK